MYSQTKAIATVALMQLFVPAGRPRFQIHSGNDRPSRRERQ